MPELPDVEGFRRFFRAHALGKTVRSVSADPAILRGVTPAVLGRALHGRRFEEPSRVGKWLTCWTDGPALLFHFGMTGSFVWSAADGGPERHRWDRLTLVLAEGGELRYRNMRKLGGVWLAHDQHEVDDILATLGPDALAVTGSQFIKLLDHRRGGVKAALMDQSFIAGIGNILADDILWQARIHPKRRIQTLTSEERQRLSATIRSILRQAVESDDFMLLKRPRLGQVRGEPGAACPRCGTPLARTVTAGRTTYFCPRCQPDIP